LAAGELPPPQDEESPGHLDAQVIRDIAAWIHSIVVPVGKAANSCRRSGNLSWPSADAPARCGEGSTFFVNH
jgi:hypothetical protein